MLSQVVMNKFFLGRSKRAPWLKTKRWLGTPTSLDDSNDETSKLPVAQKMILFLGDLQSQTNLKLNFWVERESVEIWSNSIFVLFLLITLNYKKSLIFSFLKPFYYN